MLLDRLKQLFGRTEIPRDARDLIRNARSVKDLLGGLDQLITQNEVEVEKINQEMTNLEELEGKEIERVRAGDLPERSKDNVLRRIQRLRKQMDNLEERQRIYNRNINLQIDLVGRVQALDAMELRGVDEERIDEILADYEDELSRYQGVMDGDVLEVKQLGAALDDSQDLASLEAEVLGRPASGEHARSTGEADGAVPPAERTHRTPSAPTRSPARAPEPTASPQPRVAQQPEKGGEA